MSKIVYILGAGASYGQRGVTEEPYRINESKQGKVIPIIRGVPVVNEFTQYIEQKCAEVQNGKFEQGFRDIAKSASRTQLVTELKWLLGICQDYPTVDTYARQLFVTKRISDYQRLKNAISLFLTLCQDPSKRDIRYDGFIASIINDDNTFPNDISILSWNYDSQMEFAYADYMDDNNRDINNIWRCINVLNKASAQQPRNGFGIIKLNGTAHFYTPNKRGDIWDMYYKYNDKSITSLMYNFCLLTPNNVENSLSFAWENAVNQDLFNTTIKDRTSDAEVLVVIGYSFPYVNRTVDKMILNNMPQLRHIYIQDPNAEAIKERLTAIITTNIISCIDISVYKDTAQFIVPSELE